jgi:hypothetical protein
MSSSDGETSSGGKSRHGDATSDDVSASYDGSDDRSSSSGDDDEASFGGQTPEGCVSALS